MCIRYFSYAGLSPRVRGKQFDSVYTQATLGSIPACAGEAHQSGAYRQCLWVYPRVCGGSVMRRSSITRNPGLSPRVRGKQAGDGVKGGVKGSIPACAGEAWVCAV